MDEFLAWLRNPSAGDSYVYHSGDLSADRSLFGGADTKTMKQIDAGLIGRTAWQAYERGQVTLVRKRVGHVGSCRFEYIALRCRKVARHMGEIRECSGVAA